MGVLWPDRDPERARHSLSQTLYELRGELGDGCIETAGEVLRAGPDLQVDARAFLEAAEEGDAARALEIYDGSFLEGAHLAPTRDFESWVDRTRSRLHRLHRKTCSEHIEACLEEGRRDEALSSARHWVELDPLDDEAQQHLIRLLAEEGRRSEALRQFERYRTLLARELDLEPLDQIQELVARIREGEAPGADEEPTAGPPSTEGEPGARVAGGMEEKSGEPAAEPAGAPEAAAKEAVPRSRTEPDEEDRPEDRAGGDEEGPALLRMAEKAQLPRILVVYLVASFAVLQAVDILVDRIRVPETFFVAALVLVLAGLPVVVTTALIQAGALQEVGGTWSGLSRRMLRGADRWFTWRNAAIAGVAGAAAWTAYLFLFSPGEPVAPEAEVIAVLPFSVSGSGVDDFGTGIVSLLGPNLDGVGGIRTVNSRTVIQRWDAGGGDPDFLEALSIGREVGAGSVVLGSVVSLGDRVRLLAELHSVEGERLARADAEGPLAEVLTLVDSLTVDLVRSVWRSQEPIPDLRVSAITTGSLPAMRAFFRGEELYRRSSWDSASVAFRRAMEIDSTFALAHFRFADAEIWSARSYTSAAIRAMETAHRRRDRLPSRERTLVTARQLDLEGDLAAEDTMELFVDRYPRDGEGWYFLGDVRFHAQRLLALPPAELYRPFERALELLPNFSPALIHPLEWTLVRGDSVRFHRYLDRFRGLSSEGDVQPYELWSRMRWGSADSVGVYLDRSLRDHGVFVSRAPLEAAIADPDVNPGTVLDVLGAHEDRIAREGPEWRSLRSMRMILLAATGRLGLLREELDGMWDSAPDQAVQFEIRPVLAGLAPRSFAERAVGHLLERPSAPSTAYWLALLALHADSVESARRLIEDGRGADGDLGPLLDAAGGWATVAAGDTLEGIGLLEAGLREHGYLGNPRTVALRHAWAKTLGAVPDRRREAIRRLRHGISADEFLVPNRLSLARVLEAEGRAREARTAYADVVRLLSGADPSSASLLEEARTGVERLAPP